MVTEQWSQGRDRELEDTFKESEVQEVRKLMSFQMRGKELGKTEMGAELGWYQRRGVADPKKEELAKRNRDSQSRRVYPHCP